MLAPQTIQDKKFERAVFGGYDMAQVDAFLDEILADYSALYKENATLKAKMKVVVDKLEEYRSVDEEMRKTLYSARVSAKETVSAAQTEADKILRAARSEAQKHTGNIEKEIAFQQEKLEKAKAATRDYMDKINELVVRLGTTVDRLKSYSAADPEIRKKEEFKVELPPDLIADDDAATDEKTQVFADIFSEIAESDNEETKIITDIPFGKDFTEE